MTFSFSKTDLLDRFIQLLTKEDPLLSSLGANKLFSISLEEFKDGIVPPSEDVPMPKEDEIFPDKKIPEEEDYLPNEKEVIEEPTKEIPDPYFPDKGNDIPLEDGEEFPQTDPK